MIDFYFLHCIDDEEEFEDLEESFYEEELPDNFFYEEVDNEEEDHQWKEMSYNKYTERG